MTDLPVNIDAVYQNRSPGDAAHQQHHDRVHATVNDVDNAYDVAVADGYTGTRQAWLEQIQANANATSVRAEAYRTGLILPHPRSVVPSERTVMTAPPTVTGGTTSGGGSLPTTTITDAVSVLPTNPALRYYYGGRITQQAAPDAAFWTADYVTPANSVKRDVAVEFMFDGSAFEFLYELRGSPNYYRVLVNGELVSASPTVHGTANTRQLVKADFTTRAVRRVQIESSNFWFGGLKIGPNDTVWLPETPALPRWCAFGDSLTAGSGGAPVMPFDAWCGIVGRRLGWDVWNCGLGGTGYVSAGSFVPLGSQLTSDLVANDPDGVLIAHGRNDQGSSAATVQAAAEAAMSQVLDLGVPLIILGPWPSKAAESSGVIAADGAIQAAAEAVGADLFISPVQEGWITGSGKAGTPTGSGNADLYVQSDGVHYTEAGQRYVGSRAAAEITAALPALAP